jgi:hypothetical protein
MNSYIKGLYKSGWNGEESDVRLGYSITVALHWTFRCLLILYNANNKETEYAISKILRFCILEAKTAKTMINDRDNLDITFI